MQILYRKVKQPPYMFIFVLKLNHSAFQQLFVNNLNDWFARNIISCRCYSAGESKSRDTKSDVQK